MAATQQIRPLPLPFLTAAARVVLWVVVVVVVVAPAASRVASGGGMLMPVHAFTQPPTAARLILDTSPHGSPSRPHRVSSSSSSSSSRGNLFSSQNNRSFRYITSRNFAANLHKDECSSRISRMKEIQKPEQEQRRTFLTGMLAVIVGTTVAVAVPAPQAAHATYSAYTRREQDWSERVEKGEVQFKSARDLRSQLREIAPMNSESSRIFCPNGPTAAVSPLMENKCGDRLAMPSVYGRTTDVVGNSIPGFAGGKYTSGIEPSSTKISETVGGFPTYSFK